MIRQRTLEPLRLESVIRVRVLRRSRSDWACVGGGFVTDELVGTASLVYSPTLFCKQQSLREVTRLGTPGVYARPESCEGLHQNFFCSYREISVTQPAAAR